MTKLSERLLSRLRPFWDLTALILLVVAAIPLGFLQPAMLITLASWSAYGLFLAGLAVILCRVLLPQVTLGHWLRQASEGSVAAAIVVAATVFLLSAVFLGLVLWAKT